MTVTHLNLEIGAKSRLNYLRKLTADATHPKERNNWRKLRRIDFKNQSQYLYE